ncbi:hypothetical protein E2320_022867 [Naja naja]|nr:hypothetical protein E2320_022867 [Naja naja]
MHRDELYSLVKKDNCLQKVNGTTVYPLSKKSLTSFLSYVHEKCPAYLEEGTLKKATWTRLGKFLHEHPRAPPDILVTWRAIMAALGTLYPNSPSTDSAAPLSSTTEESLPKVSPPPYESPTVSVAASAPPADTALSAPAASPPPPDDTDTTAGTFSALVASSSLSLRTEPPISAYPLHINPAGGGRPVHENINVRVLKNFKEAVTSYGIHSPYVMGLLDSLMDTNIVMLLYDWKSLFSMLLTPAQFVIWSSEYNKLADAEITRGLPQAVGKLIC